MDRMKNARLGIVFGVLNNLLNIVLPFISRTIILYTLGTEYLGLGTLFSSIINVLNVTELGFGAAVSILLYEPVAKGDNARVCSVLNFTRKVFRVIGTVVLVAGLAVMPFLRNFISGDVPAGVNIYLLYVIYLANVVCSYFLAAHKRILFAAYQRYDVETKIASAVLIGQYLLQIALLLVLKNYYLYVLLILVGTVCNNLLCAVLTRKMYPDCQCKGKIEKSDVSILKKKVIGSFASRLGETMHLSAENVVISAVLGLQILGQYTNYYFVITSLVALFAVVHNTLRPIFGNCVALDTKEENFRRFRVFQYGYLWLCVLCCAGLVCLYQDFIGVWAGAENLFPAWYAWLFALYFLSSKLISPTTVLVEAAGLLWESKYISLLSAVCNLGLNIVGAIYFGLPGVLISSALTSILINFFGYTRVLLRYYFTDKAYRLQFTKDMLIFLVSACVCILLTYGIVQFFTADTLPKLLAKGVLTVLCFGVCFLVCNVRRDLFRQARSKALQMLGKKRS